MVVCQLWNERYADDIILFASIEVMIEVVSIMTNDCSPQEQAQIVSRFDYEFTERYGFAIQ